MFNSVRARIAFAYVTVWAAILLASAAGVYLLLRHELLVEMDNGLAACAQVIGQSLTHEIEEQATPEIGEAEFSGLLRTLHHQTFPRQGITVFEGSREIGRKAGDDGTVADDARDRLAPGTLLHETRTVGGARARLAVWTVRVKGRDYTIVAAQQETAIELALSNLRIALYLLLPLALLLSAGGGYFLARQALRPVVEMAEAVDRINARNLSQSIAIPNPGDELGHLGATFNRLLGRLNRAFEQEKEFMADASHELRTPLSVCLLTTQVALDRPRTDAEYREAITTIGKHLERLNRLVQDMLTLARSEAGGYVLNKRRCHFDELVQDAVHAGRVLARGKGIQLDVAALEEAPVDADPELVRQMVMILLDNAIKYSGEGTTIELRLRDQGGTFELDVRDQGCGIPEEARVRIFDRFYRVEESRSRAGGGGAGLGLPIARWIAEAHGGAVTLVVSGAEGSTFRVRIPAALVGRPAAMQI